MLIQIPETMMASILFVKRWLWMKWYSERIVSCFEQQRESARGSKSIVVEIMFLSYLILISVISIVYIVIGPVLFAKIRKQADSL